MSRKMIYGICPNSSVLKTNNKFKIEILHCFYEKARLLTVSSFTNSDWKARDQENF